jgi:hypothetical protein
MPRIIVQAHTHGGDASLATLSERVVAEHLGSNHYTTQLIERITWAVADAEALESRIGMREPAAEVRGAEGSGGHRVSEPGRRSAAISA